ncbi:MAG: prolipoprotein diacylglyceryl transferase [Flavobacteriia bacterium]|jgi:phosphatidylglycerol:prolipoprotein diacylglycerol transferase
MILGINWNVSPELIEGWSTPNKYGLLFVSGIIIGFYVIKRMFKEEKIQEDLLDKLLMYMVISTVVGARLGHVFFYDWDHYKNNLGDIFKVWEGGLASHGAAIMILIALYVFSKYVSKKPYLWILDRVSAPIAIAGCFIRLGNLVNSEIVGKETTVAWGFKFFRHDCQTENMDCSWADIPLRHPTQIYEAAFYLATFLLLMFLYWKKKAYLKEGMLFGVFMIILWTGRFLVEFVKEGQTDRDFEGALNTGQLLSIPLALAGVFILIRSLRVKNHEEINQ